MIKAHPEVVSRNPKAIADIAVGLKNMLKQDRESVAYKGEANFYRQVACQELFDPRASTGAILMGGRLQEIKSPYNICEDFSFSKPFDNSDFKMANIPTYYFQGESDPNTPLSSARLHFESQEEHIKDAKFIEVKYAGHNPLGIDLEECRDDIWRAIFNSEDLSDILDQDTNLCADTDSNWAQRVSRGE